MLFLPAMMADGSQGFFQKNTTQEGWRFFSKNPKGLDLDGLGNQG